MSATSDFGRGYATCLRQFTFHANRLDEKIGHYAEMNAEHPTLFSEAGAIEMWFNGSSDHLIELTRPRRGVPVSEWRRARALADRAIDIGHGFRASSKSTVEEAHALLNEARALLLLLEVRGHANRSLDEAMASDRVLGLSPQSGEWSCSEDLVRA